MLRQENQDSLLSSRLKENSDSSSKTVERNSLKRKITKDSETSVPTFSASNDTVVQTEKTEKPKKTKKSKHSDEDQEFQEIQGSQEKSQKKHSLFKKKDNKTEDEINEQIIDAADYDEILDFEAFENAKKLSNRRKLGAKISRIVLAVLIVLCVYIAFLIYGLACTNYVYNDLGQVEAEVLTVEDLTTLNEYNKLSSYYLRTRILYEKILALDYELSQNADNSLQISMSYTKLLEEVSKLATDINAAELDMGYSVIQNQMYTLVYTHIAVYLQNISNAITNNDSERANQAILGRETVQSEFATLTSNMVTLCNTTKGAKNQEIYNWSPESYLSELQGGDA